MERMEEEKQKNAFRMQEEMRRMEGRKEMYLEKNEKQKALIKAEISNLKAAMENSEVSKKSSDMFEILFSFKWVDNKNIRK